MILYHLVSMVQDDRVLTWEPAHHSCGPKYKSRSRGSCPVQVETGASRFSSIDSRYYSLLFYTCHETVHDISQVIVISIGAPSSGCTCFLSDELNKLSLGFKRQTRKTRALHLNISRDNSPLDLIKTWKVPMPAISRGLTPHNSSLCKDTMPSLITTWGNTAACHLRSTSWTSSHRI